MNRISRRVIRKGMVAVAGAAMLAIGLGAPTAFGQAAPTGSAAATTQPAARGNRMIAEGVDDAGKVNLSVNKTVVITTTQPYKQVSVGQPEIADVNTIGPNNILITAKKTGTTQLIVWDDKNNSQVADIVVNMDVEGLQNDLTAMFPGSTIKVSSSNGSVVLRGQVADLMTAEKAASMASPYSAKVLNLLEVGGGQQVMLQVRFAEVDRRATNALGVNIGYTDGGAFGGSNIGQISPLGIVEIQPGTIALGVPNPSPSVTLFGQGILGDTAIQYFISALRQNNMLRVLAEPNLTAISGQEASFLAGGEFPVPVPQSGTGGGTTITIDYREFGVRLRFVPIVLGDGKIRLKMTPEVSDLDFSSPLVIQGSRIPIVNKRTVTTTVELADGQTFAIAGLLNNTVNASRDVTPLLGDIPVLGALFRSTRYERRETELVVLVTPKLVEPMNPSQVPPLPGENWRHPSELSQYLMGDIGGEATLRPRGAAPAPGTSGTGQPAGTTSTNSRYRGSYGFTPPPRATTSGSSE